MPTRYQVTSRTADIILLIATFFWGSSFVAIKVLVAAVPIYQIIILRFGIAALILLPVVFSRLKQASRTAWLSGLWLGFTMFTGFTFQTASMKYTTATQSAFLTALSVIMVPIFLIYIRKTIVSSRLWFCVFLAMLGLTLLSLNERWQLGFGDILAILGAVFFALHIIYTSIYTAKYDTIFILWVQIAAVAVFSILIQPFIHSEPWVPLTVPLGLALGHLILMVTIGCTTLQVFFQKHTDTTRAGLIYSTEPVFAAVLAYLILGETLPLRGWFGAGLIFVALIISELKGKKQSEVLSPES